MYIILFSLVVCPWSIFRNLCFNYYIWYILDGQYLPHKCNNTCNHRPRVHQLGHGSHTFGCFCMKRNSRCATYLSLKLVRGCNLRVTMRCSLICRILFMQILIIKVCFQYEQIIDILGWFTMTMTCSNSQGSKRIRCSLGY